MVVVIVGTILVCFLRQRRKRQSYLADKAALKRGGLLANADNGALSSDSHHDTSEAMEGEMLTAGALATKDLPPNPPTRHVSYGHSPTGKQCLLPMIYVIEPD